MIKCVVLSACYTFVQASAIALFLSTESFSMIDMQAKLVGFYFNT
ncbi:MAG: hypothetical protein PUP92_33425 [Rhizonema sp. PD38]|nr:hypothetical protein [Rhizonema sp. PD38]